MSSGLFISKYPTVDEEYTEKLLYTTVLGVQKMLSLLQTFCNCNANV